VHTTLNMLVTCNGFRYSLTLVAMQVSETLGCKLATALLQLSLVVVLDLHCLTRSVLTYSFFSPSPYFQSNLRVHSQLFSDSLKEDRHFCAVIRSLVPDRRHSQSLI
jgi:hypothetical protein